MDTPFQRKRRVSIDSSDSKKQRRTSTLSKALKINHSSKLTRRRTNGRDCETNNPTMIQNNRELATALNKAKSRIRELEDQRFELQSDHHRLMEKYRVLTKEVEKVKNEHAAKQCIDNTILKETCESLRSKMQNATEKLLESSVFLTQVDQSVVALLKLSDSQDDRNRNCSLELTQQLEITCNDSMQRSNEAALSITKLTPSPSSSSASSSDSCEMASPDPCASSTPSENRPGLLTTIQDQNSIFETSDFKSLLLNSTQIPPTVNNVLNTSQESMDCHNNSQDLVSTFVQHNSMDIDSAVLNSNDLSLLLCSTPECSPICRTGKNPVHRLTSTPEDRGISRYAANLSASSPQVSPAFTLCSGRRTSRRRNMMDGFRGYKEPLLNSKLRQGDPFTDCSLFQPRKQNPSKKRKTK